MPDCAPMSALVLQELYKTIQRSQDFMARRGDVGFKQLYEGTWALREQDT